jgi:hypothetical protein
MANILPKFYFSAKVSKKVIAKDLQLCSILCRYFSILCMPKVHQEHTCFVLSSGICGESYVYIAQKHLTLLLRIRRREMRCCLKQPHLFAGLVDANNNSAGIISRADIEDNDAADMNQHTANAHQHCAGTKYQNN